VAVFGRRCLRARLCVVQWASLHTLLHTVLHTALHTVLHTALHAVYSASADKLQPVCVCERPTQNIARSNRTDNGLCKWRTINSAPTSGQRQREGPTHGRPFSPMAHYRLQKLDSCRNESQRKTEREKTRFICIGRPAGWPVAVCGVHSLSPVSPN